jgi:hypothetical protein
MKRDSWKVPLSSLLLLGSVVVYSSAQQFQQLQLPQNLALQQHYQQQSSQQLEHNNHHDNHNSGRKFRFPGGYRKKFDTERR